MDWTQWTRERQVSRRLIFLTCEARWEVVPFTATGKPGGGQDLGSRCVDMASSVLCSNVKGVVGYTYPEFRGEGWIGRLGSRNIQTET